MRLRMCVAAAIAAAAALSGCMKWDYGETEDFDTSGHGLFIVNEGNFHYGNATLSYYNPTTEQVQNEVFFRANGYKLGDVAQSMTIHGGRAWIVVNNSHVVFAIDPDTFRETGRIENLTSPRYIHFVSDTKAYITQLWDNRIAIADPRTCAVTGYIDVPGMGMADGSTEQMVQIGRYVYCNCWSYQNRIIKIDTATDSVAGSITVGMQPNSIAVDADGYLWALCDGGYEGSPLGYEVPSLWKIDPATFTVADVMKLGRNADGAMELQTNAAADTLYWVNGDVWRMDVRSASLPDAPFLRSRDTKYYGLTVSPQTGDIYVADAIDYQQQGMIYRYSAGGELLDEFYVGVTPAAFCWK